MKFLISLKNGSIKSEIVLKVPGEGLSHQEGGRAVVWELNKAKRLVAVVDPLSTVIENRRNTIKEAKLRPRNQDHL